MNTKLKRWWNDLKKGYIRLRFCERCGILSRNVHWSKNDIEKSKNGSKHTVYGHIWLCDTCYYGKFLGL